MFSVPIVVHNITLAPPAARFVLSQVLNITKNNKLEKLLYKQFVFAGSSL
jgi:hypothetical protein